MKLRKTDRDLPALAVLALLVTGPRHTYEMHRMMIDFRKDFVSGLPRSMYHSVERLLRAEHLRVAEIIRESGRPERTVYALTDAGRAELRRRLTALLAVPDADSDLLVGALSFLGCLDAEEAVGALRARLNTLAERRAGAAAAVAATADLPRILLVESEYARARLTAEHAWVEGLIDDIDSGTLRWPDPAQLTSPAQGGRT